MANKLELQYLHLINLFFRPAIKARQPKAFLILSARLSSRYLQVGNLLLHYPTDEFISSRVFACDLLMDKKLLATKTDFRTQEYNTKPSVSTADDDGASFFIVVSSITR